MKLSRILPYIPLISTGWSVYTLTNQNRHFKSKTNVVARSVFSDYQWFPKEEKKANRRVNQIRAGSAFIPILGNLIVGGIDLFCYLKSRKNLLKPQNIQRTPLKPQNIQKNSISHQSKSQSENVSETEVLENLKKQVERGDVPAMVDLAWMNLFDRSVPQSDEADQEAAELLQKAYKKGNVRAAVHLAHLYENGIGGIAVDQDRAKELYEEAAKNGDTFALRKLGTLSEREARFLNISLAASRALQHYKPLIDEDYEELAIDANSEELELLELLKNSTPIVVPTEQKIKNLENEKNETVKQALKLYEKGAKKGDIGSMVCIASIFVGPSNLLEPSEEEMKRVVKWLNKAIAKENSSSDVAHLYYVGQAKYKLAEIYQAGWKNVGGDTEENKKQAKLLFEEAAQHALLSGDQVADAALMGVPLSKKTLDHKLDLKRRIRKD